MRFYFKTSALILTVFLLVCLLHINIMPFQQRNSNAGINQETTHRSATQTKTNSNNKPTRKVLNRNRRHQFVNQNCQVPNLDPFHPDVLPFVAKTDLQRCRMKKYGRVEGNVLHLKIENVRVQRVTLRYILRSGDFAIRYSPDITLVGQDKDDKTGKHCWEECGSMGGNCTFCGKNGYCCRPKFDDCPKELQAMTDNDYHSCVYLKSNDQEKDEEKGKVIDLQHQLTDSYFLLEIIINGKVYKEYHVAFHKVPSESRKNHEKPNILILMLDSLSAANAERQLNKTFNMLNNDRNSFIFKGHSIVGDGTTAQLCAMLTGIPEDKLPEARRGMAGGTTVDRWPFIFKDLHKLGYHTLFSEDQTSLSTFQYRLHGFQNNPTTYYVRPFWMASESWLEKTSSSCSFTQTLDILKRFHTTYKEFNTFSLATVGGISHNSLNTVGVADDELIEMYDTLRRDGILNDTVVILFGDHGLRAGGLRSTVQGKLEERLPFIALTLPENFAFEENSPLLDNLIDNSHVLTSHFDTYATLQHLLNWPKIPNTGLYGKSLFTNIKKLNRTCANAGVEPHWCPCLDYEIVNVTTDKAVLKLVSAAIDDINKMMEDVAKGMCATLKLHHVIRAGRRKPNTDVIEFAASKRDGRCDSCGIVKDKKTNVRYSYEINFQVSPSGGNFEIQRDILLLKDGTFKVIEMKNKKYSRTNIYGKAPSCLAKSQRRLDRFCFCKGFSYDKKN